MSQKWFTASTWSASVVRMKKSLSMCAFRARSLNVGRVGVAELLRGHVLEGGGALDLHAVLVRTGAEQRPASPKRLPPLQGVGQHHAVHVADVWGCGGVLARQLGGLSPESLSRRLLTHRH